MAIVCASQAKDSREPTADLTAISTFSSVSKIIRSLSARTTICIAAFRLTLFRQYSARAFRRRRSKVRTSLQIPEGTQNGTQLKIKGKGVPEVQGKGRGDLIVHIDVRIPTKLTREQRRIFEELEDTLPVNNDPHEKGLLDKVKDYFM